MYEYTDEEPRGPRSAPYRRRCVKLEAERITY